MTKILLKRFVYTTKENAKGRKEDFRLPQMFN